MPQTSVGNNPVKEIAFYDRRDGKATLRMPPHLHDQLELICVFDGEVTVRIDGTAHVLHGGDALLVFPSQIHFPDSDSSGSFCIFDFSPYLVPDIATALDERVPSDPVVRGAMDRPQLRSLFDALAELCSAPNPDTGMAATAVRRGYLLALVSALISEMELIKPSRVDTGAMRAIVSFCMDHFSENISLDLLSEKLGLNKFYISHLFGERMGMSLNDYINYLRVRVACRYLRHTERSISDISDLVGFNSARTFNRAFIKFFGITPSEYRGEKKISERRVSFDRPSPK